MWRQVLCVVLVVCITAVSSAVSGQNNSGTQMILSVRLSERTSAASPLKVLAEPTIATIVGRAFSYESGGTVKPKTGDGDLEIGTRVTGKLERTGNGIVQLALRIRIGSAVSQKNDPKTDLVRTEIIAIRTLLRPGQKKRLNCSASRWCEVSLDDVK